jgi:hypothetical protein
MTTIYCILWAVAAATIAWGIATIRAAAALSRTRAQMRREITYWQDETSRARTQTAQIARDSATWADAWKKGRDDVIAVIPLVTLAHDGRIQQNPIAKDGTVIT